MKKFILMLMLAIFSLMNMNAQIAYEKAKLLDNTYVSVVGGITSPLDMNSVTPFNTVAGVKLGKNISPIFGVNVEGLAGFGDNHFQQSKTFVKNIGVGLNGTIDFTNLIYNSNKVFHIGIESGLGAWWALNTPTHDNTELVAKTGATFTWNLGKWAIYTEPIVFWNLTNQINDAVTFNKHNAQLALMVGVTYYFKTSHSKKWDIGNLNEQINQLKAKLAKKPNIEVHTVTKVIGNTSIFFAQNSSELDEKATATLDAIDSTATVSVAGYASPEGTAEYNQNLSEERAHMVANYLEKRNIKVTKIIGYGATIGATSNRVVIVTAE